MDRRQFLLKRLSRESAAFKG